MEQGGRALHVAVCAATAAAVAAAVHVVWQREAIVRKVQALGEVRLADSKGYLRPVRISDAARIFSLVDADRKYLQEWLPWVKYVQSQADEEFFLGTCEHGQRQGTHVVYAICSPLARDSTGKTNGAGVNDIVGLISFNAIDTTRRMVYIGCDKAVVDGSFNPPALSVHRMCVRLACNRYWLASSAQGHGLMTCAVNALCDVAFSEQLGYFDHVEICAAEQNRKSRAIPERIDGFVHLPTVRDWGPTGGAHGDVKLCSYVKSRDSSCAQRAAEARVDNINNLPDGLVRVSFM